MGLLPSELVSALSLEALKQRPGSTSWEVLRAHSSSTKSHLLAKDGAIFGRPDLYLV